MGSPALIPTVRKDDWVNLNRVLRKLAFAVLGAGSVPSFGSIMFNDLLASRLTFTDANKVLASIEDLTAWIAGTSNRITVANDGDGSITLSTPQDIHSGASPTFAGLTLTGLTASRLLASNGSKAAASVANLANWIAGTTNRVTVSNDGDGTVTLSAPQDIHTGASPTFAGLTTTAGRYSKTTRATTTYQILITDHKVAGNTDAGAWTITLPAGAVGQTLKITNTGSSGNLLTAVPSGAEHLLGANDSWILYDGESLEIEYYAVDGWY